MKRLAVFDFDGTLVDTSRGVFGGVNYALEKMGRPRDTDRANLSRMIGPPIEDGFATVYGITDPAVVDHFRVYYRSQGVKEYEPYLGMEALLRRLKEAGVRLAVATMKPEVFTRAILAELGWSDLFDEVNGVLLDAPTPKKSDLIARALAATATAQEDAVMVGDHRDDMLGAKQNGLTGFGVLWGFGSKEELLKAGAARVYRTPQSLQADLQN